MNRCIVCGNKPQRSSYRYCSNKCQREQQYRVYIAKWKQGEVAGDTGVRAKNISAHIRRYLQLKHNNSCSLCGWNKINPITHRVPLEIDHIDGNSDNNDEANLRLLCPNCHSLTPYFRNLNKGKGRSWRRLKYIRST